MSPIGGTRAELPGVRSVPEGDVADHPLGALCRIVSARYQTLTVTPSTARGSTTER